MSNAPNVAKKNTKPIAATEGHYHIFDRWAPFRVKGRRFGYLGTVMRCSRRVVGGSATTKWH
ncbi:hypothetical protein CCP4SC76_2130002 [Gammaproteobacteria bacterium]